MEKGKFGKGKKIWVRNRHEAKGKMEEVTIRKKDSIKPKKPNRLV